jgi:hypothetical protein
MKIMSRADLGLPVCQDHEAEHKKQEDCRLTAKQVPGADQKRPEVDEHDHLATDTLHLRYATRSFAFAFLFIPIFLFF